VPLPGVTAAIEIEVPPEKVWALMCDPHRYPEFAEPTDRMIDVPDQEFGKGYVYKEHGGIAPFKSESEWTVTEFDPRRRQVHSGFDGTARFQLAIDLEPSAKGTRFSIGADVRPRWFMAPLALAMWPLVMRRRAQEAMDRTALNVKTLLEADG
jgi:carbon monoxide dehydrogenase subunit G